MSKKILFQLMTYMIVCLSTCVSSCSKDEEEDNSGTQPPTSDNYEQTENKSVKDPEGTVIINMLSASKDNYHNIGIGYEIHIDEANNFAGYSSSVQFVTVGLVNGLSEVQSIPSTGWASKVAVVPGTGYVARCNYGYGDIYGETYARLYVVEAKGNVFTVKYQSPFQLPIKLQTTSLTFSSDASSQNITLENPTAINVEKKPEWCTVTTNTNSVTIKVTENLTATQRSGEITLKNTANTVSISVTQKGSSSPKFQAGSGTEQDPYQITNAQQLKYISKALNAHFVLTTDITLNEEAAGSGWDPIGKQETPFTGTLDGQGHTIKNMWMKRPTTNGVGLFGYINNASISNLRVEISSNGVNGGENVGGICGSANNQCQIQKCSVSGKLIGSSTIGGICGYAYNNATFEQCYSEGSISTNIINWYERCAGIVGRGGKITNSYSTADLTGYDCYAISWEGSVSKCYYAGKVSSCYYFSCDGTYTYFDSSIVGTSKISNNNNCARTTAQMMTQSNYEGWDFTTIWKITEGKSYPTLRCFDK